MKEIRAEHNTKQWIDWSGDPIQKRRQTMDYVTVSSDGCNGAGREGGRDTLHTSSSTYVTNRAMN
jgi:hypothetical protein